MKKNIPLTDIIDFLGSKVKAVYGNPVGINIHYLKDPKNVDEFTLDWISAQRLDKQDIVKNSKAKAIIGSADLKFSTELLQQGKVLIIVENPKLALVKIGNAFFVEKVKPGIHPKAIIHPEAEIGKEVFIGANVVIGKCKIGDNTVIYPFVSIDDNVRIGNNVVIKSGARLGYEGFGFEKQADGSLIKFPQLGRLIISDFVAIGANTCIDKGALSDTIIDEGTKINNLCHIAHNVIIGKNVIITAHVNISGSSIIEDGVWIAPNASLRGHQTIGEGVVIGMGAVVTKNVPAGETWMGNPARFLKKVYRNHK
jgi:UDP-3-O-[3-hydroxymyristoyl] glucosamine N-acyltransferase